MKAVLMSIHPKWCEKIFNGEKTIEVRKNRPSIPTPFTVYVYQTKHKGGNATVREVLNSVYGGGKVIGSFVCDRIREIIPLGLRGFKLGAEWLKEMCLSKEQLDEYGGLKTLYSWHITEPTLFEKPRELGEFWLYNDELNRRYEHDENFCCYDGTDENGEATTDCDGENINNCYRCWEEWSGLCHKLTRPPQSYCYVEVQK